MSVGNPAEAVEVFDLLLQFFGNGERWVRGRLSDRRGNRCLSSHHGVKGDEAERYLENEIFTASACNDASEDCARFRAGLRRALSGGRYRVSDTVLRRDSLSDFNDGCQDFAELRALILQARAAAIKDADNRPTPQRDLGVESGAFVLA
jgi:hypothetical protein